MNYIAGAYFIISVWEWICGFTRHAITVRTLDPYIGTFRDCSEIAADPANQRCLYDDYPTCSKRPRLYNDYPTCSKRPWRLERWVVVVQTSLVHCVWNTLGSHYTNVHGVWNTVVSRCTNVAGSLRLEHVR